MGEFTVTRTLLAPREAVWEVLTEPNHFEGWLPAEPGTAVLDVRAGGSWQATVRSPDGGQIALTGRYDEVSAPGRLVMTVPGDVVTAITLAAAADDTTLITYGFDVEESMHAAVEESVDGVLGRISTVLTGIA
ncbi:SRPBCC domain-containing protein [Nocardioides sp. CER19]|uniref:SRPBCC family protein n=1 Tax=Nocardioides sp. CER19 TaxID=3038538 RepID=UPI0024486854|nr:SRPBCC domain-containing protein [Nocardioides sp. CER19]MDH2413887.1 SRPBCC domain-containing protein [Nocardioides sp. CER19]